METAPLPFIWRKRRVILFWAAGLVLLCAALLGAARLWIKTDSGRAFAVSQINGRDIAGYGVIEISGLSGDPLSRMAIDRVTLTDSNGKWVDAQDISIDWTPWALISGEVHLNDVTVQDVTLAHRPTRADTERPASSGKRKITATLENLQIEQLHLLETFSGTAADFKAQGKLVTSRDNEADIRLNLAPLSATTDKLSFKLSRNIVGDIHVNANGYVEPNGALATLLHLSPNQSAQLDANITGTLKAGDGFARILIDEHKAADLTVNWTGTELTTSVLFEADKLPISERIARLVGPAARVNLSATLDETATPIRVTATTRDATISANSVLNSKTRTLTEPIQIDVALANAEPLIGRAVALKLNGTLSGERATGFEGMFTATPLANSGLAFKSASGPISFDIADTKIPFTADLTTTGVKLTNQQLTRLLSGRPKLVASGAYNRETGELTLSKATLIASEARATASGSFGTREKRTALSGKLTLPAHLLASDTQGILTANYKLAGPIDTLAIDLQIEGREINGLNANLQSLLGERPTLNGRATLKGRTLHVKTAHLTGSSLSAMMSGSYQTDGAVTLDVTAQQSAPLKVGDTSIALGSMTAHLSGRPNDRTLDLSTQSGQLSLSGQNVEDLKIAAQLEQKSDILSGRILINGNTNGYEAQLTSPLTYQAGALNLPSIRGAILGTDISGQMARAADGEIAGTVTVSGDQFPLKDATIGSFKFDSTLSKAPGRPLALHTEGGVRDILLANGTTIDAADGSAALVEGGLSYNITTKRSDSLTPFNLSSSGDMTWADGHPAGTIMLTGDVLGYPVTTHTPIRWSQAEGGTFSGDLSILGGHFTLTKAGAPAGGGFKFDIAKLDLSPIAAQFGLPLSVAQLNGAGRLNPFGPTPNGEFVFSARSAIDGIDTLLEADVTGKLDTRLLTLRSSANADTLRLNFDAALPIRAGAKAQLVKLKQDEAMSARATLDGDLSALSPIALAFGHDISGMIDAQATLAGTLTAPELNAAGKLSGGTYENGLTGMRLSGIDSTATFDKGRFTAAAKGRDRYDGAFTVSGTSKDGTMQVASQLQSLRLYDRDDDDLTASGRLEFTRTKETRELTGNIQIDEAHFDITHLPASQTKAIAVRWENGNGASVTKKRVSRPTQLDIKLSAPRRLFFDGRGLASEWGLDLAISGDTETPVLTGAASLERGDLEFAGRPFVFDTGAIEFNGPLSATTIALDAERSVNGFDARVGLSGSPQNPKLELSSSPSLPEDEILSRLLFGRASVDLSALEAAQLAASVSRIIGQGGGVDPSQSLKSALGVDRFSFGSSDSGNTKVGVGQFISDNVYLELTSTVAEGTSIEVEWEPRPKLSISSKSTTTGKSKVSVKWKNDF